MNEIKASVKFQLKKVLCLGVAIGNVAMEDKEIYVNTQVSFADSMALHLHVTVLKAALRTPHSRAFRVAVHCNAWKGALLTQRLCWACR